MNYDHRGKKLSKAPLPRPLPIAGVKRTVTTHEPLCHNPKWPKVARRPLSEEERERVTRYLTNWAAAGKVITAGRVNLAAAIARSHTSNPRSTPAWRRSIRAKFASRNQPNPSYLTTSKEQQRAWGLRGKEKQRFLKEQREREKRGEKLKARIPR
jgi:hypothetical protein